MAVKYRVTLSGEEQAALLAVVNKGKGDAARIKRANVLVAGD